jgi:hypothetical protein
LNLDQPRSLTDDEGLFLRHWTAEATGPFRGPATIWCLNHRISPSYGPYPLAEHHWLQEQAAGRDSWIFERPAIPFRVPWEDAEAFWSRTEEALTRIPRLQGVSTFTRSEFQAAAHGPLGQAESRFLRAYYAEQVESGHGPHATLLEQRGIESHRLRPFSELLDNLDGEDVGLVACPWTDFASRYQQISGKPDRSGSGHHEADSTDSPSQLGADPPQRGYSLEGRPLAREVVAGHLDSSGPYRMTTDFRDGYGNMDVRSTACSHRGLPT